MSFALSGARGAVLENQAAVVLGYMGFGGDIYLRDLRRIGVIGELGDEAVSSLVLALESAGMSVEVFAPLGVKIDGFLGEFSILDKDGKTLAPSKSVIASEPTKSASVAIHNENPSESVIASDAQHRVAIHNENPSSASPSLNAIDCHDLTSSSLAMTDGAARNIIDCHDLTSSSLAMTDGAAYNTIDYHTPATRALAMTDGAANNNDSSGTFHQVVSFIILRDERGNPLPPQKGIHLISSYKSESELVEAVKNIAKGVNFAQNIAYNAKFCQFAGRFSKAHGSEYCKECVETCPVSAIRVDEKAISLSVSHADCIACGGCVGVCPSGAMEKKGFELASIAEQASFYKGFIPLLISQSDLDKFGEIVATACDKNALLTPFVAPNYMIFNEAYLVSILQESGGNIAVFNSPDLSAESKTELTARIANVNEIYRRILGVENAILMVDFKGTDEAIEIPHIELPIFSYTQNDGENLRSVFAARIQQLVRGGSFGSLDIAGAGTIAVNADKCTACMACVGACNTGALGSDNAEFALKFKASLCTACGYCADYCGEGAIQIRPDEFLLESSGFEYAILVKDSGFKCRECGSVFASARGIEKVRGMLGDLPAIFLCADCKVKVMFGGEK